MPESIEAPNPLNPVEVASVARLLWQQAGAQAGRYAEYWTKVEEALTEARHAQALRALVGLPPAIPSAAQPPELSVPTQPIETTVWGYTAWEQQILHHEVRGPQTREATPRQAPSRDL